MMTYRLNRMMLFPLCSDVAKNGRNTWNSFRSCCTCLQRPTNDQPKQFSLNNRNCLVKPTGVKQTAKRNHQTLPSDFSAHLPSLKQMEHFLSSRKVLYQHGHTSLIASCPFCASKEEGTDKPKTFTLYINKTTGSHFCNNCGSSGSWRQFKVHINAPPREMAGTLTFSYNCFHTRSNVHIAMSGHISWTLLQGDQKLILLSGLTLRTYNLTTVKF